jgi:hypothetical protein
MTNDEASRLRLRLQRLIAAGILFVSLLLAVLVPVYTDEVGWRLQMRAAIDGVDTMFNDVCGPNTLAHPVWFMMPVRWFSATANLAFADPLFIRVAGTACALLWVALLLFLTVLTEDDANRRARTQTILLSLLGMGLLPFLMVLSRPEQPVLIATTAIIIVALQPLRQHNAALWTWAKVALILLLATIALSYHLKGVLYSVIAFTCLVVCARGRKTVLPRIVGCLAMVALTSSAAMYWISRFQCPGDAELAAKFRHENIAAVIASGGSATDLVLQAVRGANPLNYVALAIPTTWPMSNWLPPEVFSRSVIAAVDVSLFSIWLAAMVLTAFAIVIYLCRVGWHGLIEPRAAIAVAILSCTLIWGASQLNKNSYEASHILPMLVIAFALIWSLPTAESVTSSRVGATLPLASMTAALISQTLVLSVLAGPLLHAAQAPGYPERQPVSVSLVGYGSVKHDINQAMAKAGIPKNRQLHRLLIDDLTYMALQKQRLPLHRLGVLSGWNGRIGDPVEYLRSRDSDGVVVGCRYLPAAMRSAASQSGEICAISRSGLDRLAEAAGRNISRNPPSFRQVRG